MGTVVLHAARRRPYAFPALLALACAIATYLMANAEDLPIRDPDGVGGPPLVRLSVILAVFMAIDVLPRALWRARLHPRQLWSALRAVIQERWTRKRMAFVLVGLFSFYVTYVAYRNWKGFLPFLRPERHDAGLLTLDRDLFGGHDPSTILHEVLGTGIANQVLSVVYVVYLAFVPISLAAALVWFGRDTRHGLWYASALCLNWVFGAVSYYLIPSMGPAFVAPQLFSDLSPTASSALQHSLWVERLTVLFGPAGAHAGDVVQSIAAFASLHVSVVLTAALIASWLKATRALRVALWTYLVLVVLATVYLGWHYVVDDVAGAVIGYVSAVLGAVATGHTVPRPRLFGRRSRPPQAGPSAGSGAHATRAPAKVTATDGSATVSALNVPNVLSAGRILLAPVVALVVLAHPDGSLLAAALFAAGGITDVIDGHLARTRGLITSVGKLLDPTADKLLVVAALVSLVAVDRLPLWVVGVIAAREVLVTALRAHAVRRGVVIAAGLAGKVKMGLQVAMVLALMAVGDPFATWVQALIAATVTLTVLSGLGYLRAYLRARTEPVVAPRVGISA
jgi:CDP-diacylglycerol--glycerol-3-phosphate 3-phosphatidyltransferase